METVLAARWSAHDSRLAIAALLGIAVVVLLITWAKLHPFLALILGSGTLGVVAGLGPADTVTSFTAGVGSTVGSVGLLIALGAMIGALLADSGGADSIVAAFLARVPTRRLPWAMALVAAIIGLPLFFEVGVVLLVPVVLLVATRSRLPLLLVGLPALAGLSVLHGLVPPHPGPLIAIDALEADLGRTLALGLLVAIPTVIVAGPVFAAFISRYVAAEVPAVLIPAREPGPVTAGGEGGGVPADAATGTAAEPSHRRPGFLPTLLTVLLPVVLMLLRAVGELALPAGNSLRAALDIAGTPMVALLAGVLVAIFTLGVRAGLGRRRIADSVGGAPALIAGILLIVAAGGGFKQTLVDAGVGDLIGELAKGAHLSAIVLGWLVAVGIRVATGSATVATIAASGIVAPVAAGLSGTDLALVVLAVGAGSLFFSHVNDAGFWLVKEYFGLTVGQTIATWSVLETIISVVGLISVLALHLIL
ncbi:MAG: gluconate:H+ symporter, GntP family [Actinomycetota bacterium]|jgi:GntP family gluconate:H+ symporter|nr:gluconate transporter [Cryptosporangiaceae bacterium]MDQ1678457.1 gluconate:H+ symporter, GntP family [Actinomycetota bacterium]